MKIKNMDFESVFMAIMESNLSSIITIRQSVNVEGVDIEDAINRRATKFKNVKGKVVTVPLNGYISHRPSIYSALGMETSSETFAGWIEDLANNPSVGAIVLDIDSPGGTVSGLTGISDKIYSLRGRKPIIAVVNDLMASAAYFIGSAADEIVANPDSLTGSIGTIGIHLDWSSALEQQGVKATIIKAGKYKGEGSPYEPLSDEAKVDWQAMIDQYYESFVSAVAKNRGIAASKVKSDFGQGRVFKAQKAKEVGMIDRIATMEQVLTDLLPKGKSKSLVQAELDLIKVN